MKSVAFFLCCVLSFAVKAEEITSCNDNFGENLQVFSELTDYAGNKEVLTGDFNGDGIQDRMLALAIDQSSKFAQDVEVLDPFVKGAIGPKPNSRDVVITAGLPEVKTLAVGIVHGAPSGEACRKFVVYNRVFFQSSIAVLKDAKAGVLRDGGLHIIESKDMNWAYYEKKLKRKFPMAQDAIDLLNGPGVGATLFWDNKTYRISWKGDKPEGY
jgi:hypothetical protein